MIANVPYHMSELDEVVGDLHSIEETESSCLALIGKVPVLLPQELSPRLVEMIGKKISVLRLDGYYIRALKI